MSSGLHPTPQGLYYVQQVALLFAVWVGVIGLYLLVNGNVAGSAISIVSVFLLSFVWATIAYRKKWMWWITIVILGCLTLFSLLFLIIFLDLLRIVRAALEVSALAVLVSHRKYFNL